MNSELVAPMLAGASLSLRPWCAADASALEPACGDPDICRLTTVPHRFTLEAAREWIERQERRRAEGSAIVLAIEPTGAEPPVGMVGLFGLEESEASARFGYWIIREWRGRGIVKEAAGLLAAWAFRELPVDLLLIDVEPRNEPSRRIAKALGARLADELTRRVADEDVVLHRYTLTRPARG